MINVIQKLTYHVYFAGDTPLNEMLVVLLLLVLLMELECLQHFCCGKQHGSIRLIREAKVQVLVPKNIERSLLEESILKQILHLQNG